MDSNVMYNMNMNDEDFPPIDAGIQNYYKSPVIKENPNGGQSAISPNKETFSPTNFNTNTLMNNSMSPIESSGSSHLDLNVTMTPRKKALSAYQARFLAVNKSKISTPTNSGIAENESDPSIISRREKQIEYGKSTPAYERYSNQVVKKARTATMPRTPEKLKKYSRRQFDGLIKAWKIKIHEWDLVVNGKSLEPDLFYNANSTNSNSSTSLISMSEEPDEIIYDDPYLEKTPTEKAIEKAIMDWRDEYRVKEDHEEVEEFSMVKKFKMGSPSNLSM